MRYDKLHVKQHDERDCGAAALSMILRYWGAYIPVYTLREEIKIDIDGSNIYGITSCAKLHGLEANALKGDTAKLKEAVTSSEVAAPFIARIINDEGFSHFVTIFEADEHKLYIGDPASYVKKITWEEFSRHYLGQIICFTKTQDFVPVPKANRIPARYINLLKKYRPKLINILLLSVLMTFLSFAISLLFAYVIGDIATIDNVAVVTEDVHEAHHEELHDHHEDKMAIEHFLEKITAPVEDIFSILWIAVAAILLSYTLQCLLELFRTWLLLRMSKGMDLDILHDYYESLTKLTSRFMDSYKAGEILQRMNDTAVIRSALSGVIFIALLNSLYLLAGGVVLYSLNKTLFAVTICMSCFYTAAIMLFRKPLRNINYEFMEAASNAIDHVKGTIDGTMTIKSFTIGQAVTQKAGKLFKTYTDKSFRRNFLSDSQEIIMSAIDACSTILLLTVGAWLIMRKQAAINEVIAFYFIFGYFTLPVRSLMNLQPVLQSALIAIERLDDIFEAAQESDFGTETLITTPSIDVKNLSFRYGHREKILNDVSFSIPAGKHVAIIGESGSGKSTLGKLLVRLYTPEEGIIRIGGKHIEEYSLLHLRKQVLYLSQDSYIFRDTLRNNLTMYNSSITDEKLSAVCSKGSLKKLLDKFPDGFDSMLDEDGGNLSSGEREMINFARAIILKPKILIADEITGNLDHDNELEIMDELKKLDGTTCIHITHHMSLIKSFDKVFTLKDGTIY